MKKIIILAILLSGCAGSRANMGDPALMAEAHAPLLCKSTKQCTLYWQRAQAWVATSSSWKIQTATDTLISTYNPTTAGSTEPAYQVVKTPNEDGTAQIKIYPICVNYVWGCSPKPYESAVSFKRFVKAEK